MSNGDASRFDAYYKWLGIPKRQQPPNHYRILALKLFESDPATIQAAADRQTAFVLDCSREKHAELGQKLVSEITAACACLLDPEARATYDEELRKQLDSAPTKALKQSRYDVQVAHGSDFAVPDVTLPATAPVPPLSPELLELKDDRPAPPPVSTANRSEALPLTNLGEEERSNRFASDRPRGAAPAAPVESAAREPEAPVVPPITIPPAVRPSGDADMSTGKIVKLVVLACVLAGAVTVGILMFLSSSRNAASSSPGQSATAQPPVATRSLLPTAESTPAPAVPAKSGSATKPAAAVAPATQLAAATAAKPAATTAPARASASPAPASQPARPVAAALAPEPRSEFWPKLANAVVLVGQQQGPPSMLNINEDGTFDSPALGSGKWRLVGRMLYLDGKSGTTRFVYDPGRDILAGDKGSGSIVARRPLSGHRQGPPAASAAPVAAAPAAPPAAGPAAQPPPAAAPATPAPAAREPGWVFPLRSVISFRRAWIRGDAQGSVDFDETTDTVTIESGEELGGFALRAPWKEISFVLHAETITGRLEVQVNKTTLKFNTATALIRKPATIVVQYDPATFKLTANVGSRQVASATVLEENFTSQLTCRLRCEGGKTRVKLSEVKVFVP